MIGSFWVNLEHTRLRSVPLGLEAICASCRRPPFKINCIPADHLLLIVVDVLLVYGHCLLRPFFRAVILVLFIALTLNNDSFIIILKALILRLRPEGRKFLFIEDVYPAQALNSLLQQYITITIAF